MQEVQNRTAAQVDDVSSMMDKENDFNLKVNIIEWQLIWRSAQGIQLIFQFQVIASCGDNIIAVANPALMNRNQPAITKEQPIKEEIALRDRRDWEPEEWFSFLCEIYLRVEFFFTKNTILYNLESTAILMNGM